MSAEAVQAGAARAEQVHHVPRLAVSVNKGVESGLIDGGSNFLVAYDGSLASRASMEMMMNFFFKYDKKSKIDVLHIYDAMSQDGLPKNLKKDTIEHDLMAYDVSWGARFTRHIRPKLNNETKEGKELVKFTYELESEDKTIDFLVMGFHGRKTANEQDLAGSDASYILAYARCSAIIVKRAFDLPADRPARYVVPVDPNKWSEKALFDALTLSRPGDEIHVLHVRIREDEAARAAEFYQTLIDRVSAKMKFPRKMIYKAYRHGGEGAANDILAYIDEIDADFVCMGVNAGRLREKKPYLGSRSSKVLCLSPIPVIVSHYDEEFEGVMLAKDKAMVVPKIAALPDDLAERAMTRLSEIKSASKEQ